MILLVGGDKKKSERISRINVRETEEAQTKSTAGTKGMWAIELLGLVGRGDDRLLFNSISCYVRGVHLAAYDL